MRDGKDDSRLGPLVLADRPLSRTNAWLLMLAPALLLAGSILVVNPRAWPLSVSVFVVLLLVAVVGFGDRLLIEQRVYERALVSRTLLPMRPSYALPLGNVERHRIHVTPRVNWLDKHEHMLPASRILRCLPWGDVVRIPGGPPRSATVRHGAIPPIPEHPWEAETGLYWPLKAAPVKMMWAFSFGDPDAAAALIADLATKERARIGAER